MKQLQKLKNAQPITSGLPKLRHYHAEKEVGF